MDRFTDTLEAVEARNRDLAMARQILEAAGYQVTSPDEVAPPPEPPNQDKRRQWWEQERRQVWLQAWCATAQSANCVSHETCTGYAEVCLKAFDATFSEWE